MQSYEDIFLTARQIADPAERTAFLNRACAGDTTLRARVEGLLVDAESADAFFQTQADVPTTPADFDAVGTVIGRYKLLEKIGEGGMGIVYMAEQRDPVVRRVALKIIKAGMDTKQVVARFEAERQALALMDHPNIAKVLDGGATEQGRPYFVMDLVQGLPITRFCDEAKLSTHERLRLFLDVCAAVQHAHQKGIIHRDLKPSNILVTLHGDQPVPKVIDFGIAKATQQRLTEKTLFTQFQNFIGTPAYMSPEQASLSGLDIDTRSDIYSLGVLLYETLTGQTPFDAKELMQAGLDEMRRTLREKEPPRLSARLSQLSPGDLTTTAQRRCLDGPKLIDLLRGDLDWIVTKAIEKDRARRYETANGLAADIRRYLASEPVLARPPSAAYRFRKLVRRNKLKFATAAFAVSVLLLAAVVSTWQAIKATRAERKAQAEAERANKESVLARSVRDFLIQQVLGVNPYMGEAPDPNRRESIAKIDRAIGAQFTNQPLVEAELRYALGDAYYGVGDRIGTIRQLERVLDIRRRELGLTNSDTLWALASTAEAYYWNDRKDEGEKLLREGLAVVRAAPHALSSGEAEVLAVYSELRYGGGDPVEAYSLLQEAIAVARQTADPKSWRFQNKLMWLARYAGAAGRTNEAEAMFAEQVPFREREFGPNHPMTAALLQIQGEYFANLGRTNEAIGALERALSIFRRSLDPNKGEISFLEVYLARLFEGTGRLEEAAGLYRSAYPRWTSNLAIHSHRDLSARVIAEFFVRHQMGNDAKAVLTPLNDYFEAHPPTNAADFETFLRVTVLTKDWPAAANLCRLYFDRFAGAREGCQKLARSLAQARRFGEARRLYDFLRVSFPGETPKRPEEMEVLIEATVASQGWPAAADLYRTNFDSFPDSLWIWLNKAWVFRYAGEDALYQRIVAKALDALNAVTADGLHVLIEILALGLVPFSTEQVRQLDQAMITLKVALPGRSTDLQIYGYRAIGLMQLRLGRFDRCLAALDQAASRQANPEAYSLFIRAMCLHRLSRFPESRAAFEQAEAIMKTQLGEPFSEAENFLPAWQIYQHVLMHRETRALLGLNEQGAASTVRQ